jgi:hypothetical protein
VKLLGVSVLENLAQCPWEVLEMLVVERLLGGVTPEIKRG